MDDKELQELFEAKRTVEANRRRQAELRKRIEELSAATAERTERRRTMPLWPVWTGAAAAAIALLLVMRPFTNRPAIGGEGPALVAEAVVPEGTAMTETTVTDRTVEAIRATEKPIAPKATVETWEMETTEPILPIDTVTPAPTVDSTPSVAPTLEAPAQERRVMRRTSSLIACTQGCTAPDGVSEKEKRNVQINLMPNESYADATIYSFPINK